MSDIYSKYIKDGIFHSAEMVNDDLFEPIRILYNKAFYISACKLLLIAIDSVAYVEYGDSYENIFIKWLKEFANLGSLGISEEELWEHRNSLLHMSNLESRKVAKGKVRRIAFYAGKKPDCIGELGTELGIYGLYELIQTFGKGIGAWLDSYSSSQKDWEPFLERYERIVSDGRMVPVVWQEPKT